MSGGGTDTPGSHLTPALSRTTPPAPRGASVGPLLGFGNKPAPMASQNQVPPSTQSGQQLTADSRAGPGLLRAAPAAEAAPSGRSTWRCRRAPGSRSAARVPAPAASPSSPPCAAAPALGTTREAGCWGRGPRGDPGPAAPAHGAGPGRPPPCRYPRAVTDSPAPRQSPQTGRWVPGLRERRPLEVGKVTHQPCRRPRSPGGSVWPRFR